MGYKRCPNCQGMNREEDTQCYQCEGKFDEMPAPAAEAAAPAVGFDTNPDRKSTALQGLRAGALGGLFVGIFRGILVSMFATLFASALTNSVAGIGAVGLIVFLLVVGETMVYGVLLGVILGVLDELCYQADAARVGSYFGFAWALVTFVLGSGSLLGLFTGAVFGALVGVVISYVEKRIFRKQYAEL